MGSVLPLDPWGSLGQAAPWPRPPGMLQRQPPWQGLAKSHVGMDTHGSQIWWFCTGGLLRCWEFLCPLEPCLCPPCHAMPVVGPGSR